MRDKHFIISNDTMHYQVIDLSQLVLMDIQLAETSMEVETEGFEPEIVVTYMVMLAGGQTLKGSVARMKTPDLANPDPKHVTLTWVERLATAFNEYQVIRTQPFDPNPKQLRV